MLDDSQSNREMHRARARLLDGAIEWHPPRIAKGLLARLRTAASWPEAAVELSDTITKAINASSSRVWIVDLGRRVLCPPATGNASAPPPEPFDPRDAEWIFSPGIRRVAAAELRREPLLRRLFGPVAEGGCGLLLTTASESVPTTCVGWVIDDEGQLPEWIGRVLSEFAIGVPSWWDLHEKVREQSKRLEAMEEDRDIAVACRGLLHDLDNAIFPIRCRLDLLFSPVRTADELRHLESISASIDQLAQLALGLRSRLDHSVEPEAPTVLADWWESQRVVIAGALPPRTTLVGAIHEALPPISMPEAALTQVVVNLAANAGKAIGSDGAVVVSAREVGPHRVRITVSDNGAGIPAESLETLRRTIRARRAEGIQVHGPGGRRHGCGLAIVEELVERWGGSLEIESSAGEGTRIGFIVPVASRDEPEKPRAIVEIDDARQRWVVVEMLRCLGVHAMPRDTVAAGSEDGRLEDHSADCEQEPHAEATIWVADGPAADSPLLLEWLEADEGRLAIALGEPSRSHARIRRIDGQGEDGETLAALRRVIESDETPHLGFGWTSMDGSRTGPNASTAGRHRKDDAGGA